MFNRAIFTPAAAAAAVAILLPAPDAVGQSISIQGCSNPQITGSAPNWTLTCGGGSVTPTGVPSGCTITPTPSLLGSAGGTLNLAASCSGGDSPITFASWTKNGAAAPGQGSNGSYSETLPANTGSTDITYRYKVTASNGAGSTVLNEVSVTVAAAGNNGGGGAPPPVCDFRQNTGALSNWSINSFRTTSIDNESITVTSFTPPTTQPGSSANSMTAVQYPQNGFTIKAWISEQPCGPSLDGNYRYGEAVYVPFSVGKTLMSRTGPIGVTLTAGKTYYFNALYRNIPEWGGGASCGFSNCGIKIELSPAGYIY